MKYDLVFEGGGAKGMVFVGACQEFFDRGHTFDRLLGTSAGAITAALMAAGYRPEEMLEALTEKENGKSVFAGFMGMPSPFTDEEIKSSEIRKVLEAIDIKILFDPWEKWLDDKLAQALAENEQFRHVLALIERGGWYAADPFITWLETKLDSGTWSGGKRAFSGATLAELFDATGVEVSMVASDTTDGRILVLNHLTAPECPVVWAVRMSMSIPLVWDEVIWKSSWGQYLGRDITGHAIVDGGLLSNFPIELFISDEPQVVKLMGPKKDNPVLGLLIDENLPVPQPKARGMIVDINIKPTELRTIQRLQRLANAATSAHDKMVIDEYSHLIVRLPAAGYGTTEFDMSDVRRSALVNAGRSSMAAYFDEHAGQARSARIASRGIGESAPSKADRIATAIFHEAGQ